MRWDTSSVMFLSSSGVSVLAPSYTVARASQSGLIGPSFCPSSIGPPFGPFYPNPPSGSLRSSCAAERDVDLTQGAGSKASTSYHDGLPACFPARPLALLRYLSRSLATSMRSSQGSVHPNKKKQMSAPRLASRRLVSRSLGTWAACPRQPAIPGLMLVRADFRTWSCLHQRRPSPRATELFRMCSRVAFPEQRQHVEESLLHLCSFVSQLRLLQLQPLLNSPLPVCLHYNACWCHSGVTGVSVDWVHLLCGRLRSLSPGCWLEAGVCRFCRTAILLRLRGRPGHLWNVAADLSWQGMNK